MRVAVLGAGSWGTALAAVLGRKGFDVAVWAYEPEVAVELSRSHANSRYLPGVALPPTVRGTVELSDALAGAELVVAVSPSHVTRAVMTRAGPLIPPNVPIVCATKGIENDSLMTMDAVLEDVLPASLHGQLTYLSGPSFAKEVAQGLPTAVVVAARDEAVAARVQHAFAVPFFRVYTSTDVVGVELGGALKNVIAIAAGVSDGLGFGHNARSGLITRGLAEMSRLAVARGGQPLTMSGLAGMGDLVLTCTGELSRNRQVGIRLGQGEPLDRILDSMVQVAEGVKTALSVHDLAGRMGVEMPICEGVYSVLYEGRSPRDAVASLLSRELKAEFRT